MPGASSSSDFMSDIRSSEMATIESGISMSSTLISIGPNTNTFYGSINRFVDRTASTTVALIPGPRQSLWITGLQNPANPSDAVPYSYITGGSGSSYFANSTITNLNVTSDTVSSMYVTNETVAAMNVSTVSGTVSLTDANATIRTVSSNNYYYVQKMTGAAGSLMGATCLSQNGLVLAVGASDYNSDIGAIYVYTRRSITLPFSLSQTLTVTPVSSPGNFGQSVSVSSDGTTIIGGAPNDNGSIGATYVFFNPGYSNSVPTFMWSQQAYLVGTGYIGNGEQGWQPILHKQSWNWTTILRPYD